MLGSHSYKNAETIQSTCIGFFGKVISTLKSNKMDFQICESLCIYRLKSILQKSKKRKAERKTSDFDSNTTIDIDNDIDIIISKILKSFELDGQIIILSIFLLEKFIYKNKIILDGFNFINLFTLSLLETIKYNIDEPDINTTLICSMLKTDKDGLLDLEMSFLNLLDYKLKVEEEKFFTYKQKIMIPWIDYLKSNL